MEIITYVREGAISHEDSLGNKGRTESGDVQVMSAGTGIRHSEYNHEDVETRIFQIWIIPTRTGEEPAWGSKPFPKGDRSGQRSEEHTSELQSLMRISYAVFCLKKKKKSHHTRITNTAH